jgi:hypothetical protein
MPMPYTKETEARGKDADQHFMENLNRELSVELGLFIKQHFDRRSKLWIIDGKENLEGLNDEQLGEIVKHFTCVDVSTIRQRNLNLQDACQLNVRRYKSMIQQNQEFFLSKWGNDEQRVKYTPIVLRRMFKDELQRQYHEGGAIAKNAIIKHPVDSVKQVKVANAVILEKLYEEYKRFGVASASDTPEMLFFDGDQFTFVEDQEIEVTYKDCYCNIGDQPPLHNIEQIQNGACPNVEINIVKEHVPQLKHNIGAWNCNGCLVNGGRGSVQALKSEAKEEPFHKATKWCPNFLAGGMGPMLAAHGVERWHNAIAGKVEKLCFGGIMHIQMQPQPEKNSVRMDYKCDTCGLTISEELEAAQEQIDDLKEQVDLKEDEEIVYSFDPKEKTNGQAP